MSKFEGNSKGLKRGKWGKRGSVWPPRFQAFSHFGFPSDFDIRISDFLRRNHEAFIKFFQCLRQHAGPRQHGHEVVVAFPARDDVEVEVVGDAGAGARTEVQADVEALCADGGSEEALGEGGEFPEFQALGLGEVGEVGDFAIRPTA